MDLEALIRNVPDFPKPGIQFKDITTLLKNGPAFKHIIDGWRDRYADRGVDAIVGAEARGFMFGGALAYALGLPFVPVRKPGKLPAETLSETFQLEYGTDTLEIHKDALNAGERVVLIDDLLATGGTMEAVAKLVERLGAEIVEIAFVIELPLLKGRERLRAYPVHTLVEFMVE
ncbi:MAG TPA: adenine phosphoribosyltransferase [Candidatus Hydrogenedentes bacterium]|nr:adenine phosphoribosyltransferase [Candidatus Hydrogenedentota bacterium]HQE83377.1 adenine phosphoribosyltransferase [Candidatus Hydrogenedentota bacterium]HQH53010.1 adenine phosphoribosyltransferase [Candidatus Hydrogenedentota bacterium]HQM49439.1 adenine phosphoribosyltransferase [Candidatus Hydrogenedentota bacterium]